MKNKFNYLLKTLFIFISLLFFGCETQEEVVKQENHKHIHVSEKSFKELILDVNFKKSFSKLNKNKTFRSSDEAKSAIENQYGFTITNDVAKIIESDYKTSYTFSISRESTSNLFFENLVIEIDSVNASKFYIAKYVPSEKITRDVKNDINFKGDIQINELDTNITNTSSKYTTVVIVKSLCTGIPYDCGGYNPSCGFGLFTIGTYTPDEANTVETGGSFTGIVIGENSGFIGQSAAGSGAGSGTVTSSNINTVYTLPVPPIKTQQQISTEFSSSLTPDQLTWFSDQDHANEVNIILNYLTDNQTLNDIEETNPNYVFAKELIDVIKNDVDVDSNALSFVLEAKEQDKINNDLDDLFMLSIDDKMDIDVASYMLANPTDPLWIHFTIQCAVLRANHPDWSDLKIYWEASKEFIHISLDALGLFPVFGEVADLTNGVLYTIEGDGVNATLSYASAVPLAGWVTISTKYAIKINEVATIGTKIKLVWKVTGDVISFGSRNQLRKVLGLLPGNPLQAHHLIPWSSQTKMVVQKAAKSGSAFHLNEALNGIAVAAWRNQPNHNIYNNVINSKLDEFRNLYPNATPNECYEFLTDLVNDIRTWVINNPNSHLNEIVLP